jgi:hypothetical protein
MTLKRTVLRLLLVAAAFTQVAHAAPTVCTSGNTDSTCMNAAAISAPAQSPPAICQGAGESVTSAPSWTGSTWSPGTCSYTPPPTCPNGTVEQTAPSWDGSNWGGLSCTPFWSQGVASDGNPYALFLKYCGVTTEPAYDFDAGKPYPKSMSCTTSLAGATRATSADGFPYWSTPSSTTTLTTGFTGWGLSPNLVTPGLEVSGNTWVFLPGAWASVLPSGAVPVWGAVGVEGYGEAEVYVFGCPSSYPNIDVASLNANGDSNPLAVECSQ